MDRSPSVRFAQASLRGCSALVERLAPDGSLGCDDLAAYYKLPTLLLRSGLPEPCGRVLGYLAGRFGQPSGRLASARGQLSQDAALCEFTAYMDGWVAMGAQRAGRFELSSQLWSPLRAYWNPDLLGFSTHEPGGPVDMLTTAHLGLTALYFGDLALAEQAGQGLAGFIEGQVEAAVWLVRRGPAGLLPSPTPEQTLLYAVDSKAEGQAGFLIGYPLAFLSLLARLRPESQAAATAAQYFQFARCSRGVAENLFSHKIAWGSALYAGVGGGKPARELAVAIGDFIVSQQGEDGLWHAGAPEHFRLDQSAELALWLLELVAEL